MKYWDIDWCSQGSGGTCIHLGSRGTVLSVAEFNFSSGVQRIHELLPSTNNQTLAVDSPDHNSWVPYLYLLNVNICAKFHSFHSYLNWMKEARHIFVEGFLFMVLSNSDQPATVPLCIIYRYRATSMAPISIMCCYQWNSPIGFPDLLSATHWFSCFSHQSTHVINDSCNKKLLSDSHGDLWWTHVFQAGRLNSNWRLDRI